MAMGHGGYGTGAGGKPIRVVGQEDVVRNLTNASKRLKNAIAAALYMEGNNIMTKSKRLVPVDLGILKNSGYVTMPEESGTRILIELGYGGGPAREYAVLQHERLDFQHPDGGQAKFLQAALEERQPHIGHNVASLAKRAFDRGAEPVRNPGMPVDPDAGALGGGG